MKLFYLVLFLIIYYSCSSKPTMERNTNLGKDLKKMTEEDTCLSYFEEKAKYRKIAFRGIIKNDKKAYDDATDFLIMHSENLEQLFFSINMAYKNSHPKAFYDTYNLLQITLEASDTTSALYYFSRYNLAKSYELGYKWATHSEDLLKDRNGNIRTSDFFIDKMKALK